MVLEQFFKLRWIERKEHAFFLGFAYSVIGLISARLVFPSNIGLMSVAFTSIMLIPSLNMLLKMEENVEIRKKKLSLSQLFKDHKDIFKVYIFMFLGIFLAYSIVSLIYPNMAIKSLFAPQLKTAGIAGYGMHYSQLSGLILNNLVVFVACFLLSLAYGAGSVLFLTWNASVWGIVFGFFVNNTASYGGADIFVKFGSSLLPFLPHMATEALAYISAAIVGGVVSTAVLREKLFSKKFHHIITDALIFLVLGLILVALAAYLEVNVFAFFR